MATKHDTSKARSGRNQAKQAASAATTGAPGSPGHPTLPSPSLLQSPLVQAIEAERAQLLLAHGVLKCLYEVLLYGDDDDAVFHAEAAHAAARLIDESVARLDVVKLAPMIEALKERGDYEYEEETLEAGLGRKNEVRESAQTYLC